MKVYISNAVESLGFKCSGLSGWLRWMILKQYCKTLLKMIHFYWAQQFGSRYKKTFVSEQSRKAKQKF